MIYASRNLIVAGLFCLVAVGCGGGSDSTTKGDGQDSKASEQVKKKSGQSDGSSEGQSSDQSSSDSSPTTLTGPSAVKHIDAALVALGGLDKIAASKIGRVISQIEGVFHHELSGQFQRTDMFHLPGRLRRVIKGKSIGETLEMGYVLNGDVQWMQIADGPPMDVTGLQLRRDLDGMNVLWLLADLRAAWSDLKNVAGTANAKTIQVNGQHPQWGEFRLVMTNKYKLPALLCLGEKCWTFGNYQKINDFQIPMSVIHSINGQQKYEVKIGRVEFFSTAQPQLFQTPKRK